MSFDDKITELKLKRPEAKPPVGNYVATKFSGKMLFISGQISIDENVHTVNLEGSRDRVGAKLLLEKLAEELGIELNLPWNFVPESISIVGKK